MYARKNSCESWKTEGILILRFRKNNSTKHYYESSDLKEAKYKLDYLFKTKGIGVITGNPGMGKTTTIRKYLSELNRALYKPIYICMTTLNDNDFYRQLIKELGYEPKFRKCDNFRLVQQIIKEFENKKQKVNFWRENNSL